MRAEKNQDLCLRIGVKQGGCSGMSYTMELEDRSKHHLIVKFSDVVCMTEREDILIGLSKLIPYVTSSSTVCIERSQEINSRAMSRRKPFTILEKRTSTDSLSLHIV
ncbi:Iron-sulfur assembly protein IscA [Carex littledalei]|uniref:Iron-sulfur assembly protein IscA n=1 Tax=Carex littledalei TaxID=544730 RepID=A0A833RAS6_9POAL|nr:Iron-sulfur assembly protein IscA [Carex littledalei]